MRNAFILFTLLFHLSTSAQSLTAKEGSFGIDERQRIIVWHQKNLDSLVASNENIKDIAFGGTFKSAVSMDRLSYSEAYPLKDGENEYALYVTKFPIVQFEINQDIKDEVKSLGYFTYFFNGRSVKNTVGIEHRGNLSLTFPKKSYDLEFWTDSIQKQKKDIKFHGLKMDDDYILDGLFNEPLRLRSTLATKLWKEVHNPYYRADAPKARSGADVCYVELFKNGNYQGIYAFSESVGRPLLELKEHEGQNIHGEMFKASSYEGAPSFLKAPEYNNLFPHWAGFAMEYPVLDYKSHWQDIHRLVNLVVNSKDAEFTREIGKQVHIDNVIDYYLFVNLLRATDNLGKNYYLARYDENSPYFFVPWDLDGVMGIIQDGKRIPTTDDVLGNGLFDRLLQLNPNNFKKKLQQRWAALRKTEYSDSALSTKMHKIYTTMTTEKVYERERLIWPSEKTDEEHYDYLKEWLTKRLVALDRHFKNMESSSEDRPVRR